MEGYRNSCCQSWGSSDRNYSIRKTCRSESCRFLPLTAAVIAVIVLMLTGCMAGPDFIKPPEVKVENEWMETGDPRVKIGEDDFAVWWETFKDPVLDTLIDQAYNQNLDLQIAGIRILEARAQLAVAVGNLYPQQQQINSSLVGTHQSDNAAGSIIRNPNFSTLDLTFDAAWELDFFGKFRRSVESGMANLEATVADYDDLLVTLTAEVARIYVLIRTFEQRLIIANQNVKIQRRSLQIAEARFEGGDVSELDVAQAKSLLASTESLIPRLETSLRQSKNALAVLLGLVPDQIEAILGPPDTIPKVSDAVVVSIPAELMRRRPDIRLAEYQLAAQSAQIGVARADLYPHFTLFGSIGWATSSGVPTAAGGLGGSSLGDLFDAKSLTWNAGPAFSWDFLNYGRIRNRVRVEDARFQQLAVNYENTVLRALQEVEDSMVAFLRSQEEEKILQYGVAASQRAVDLSLLQYREGLVDYQRVLDTQRFLTDQSDALTATSGDVVVNLVSLYKSLGGGWQQRKGDDVFVSDKTRQQMVERTNWGSLLTPPDKDVPRPLPEEQRGNWRTPRW